MKHDEAVPMSTSTEPAAKDDPRQNQPFTVRVHGKNRDCAYIRRRGEIKGVSVAEVRFTNGEVWLVSEADLRPCKAEVERREAEETAKSDDRLKTVVTMRKAGKTWKDIGTACAIPAGAAAKIYAKAERLGLTT